MGYETLLSLVGGVIALVGGAEILVRGASRLAVSIGISPLVVGLTVVALGTSSPELAVSLGAVLKDGGSAGIALGNVIGSNIFNVLFILGVSAVVTPLVVNVALIRRDVPVMIGASVLVLILALDGALSVTDGLILSVLAIVYVSFLVVQSKKEQREAQKQFAEELPEADSSLSAIVRDLVFIAIGLVFLVLGADWLVGAATKIAKEFGVSDLIIGLTIVAVGTSLPEVAASIAASIKGERDIAVGNVVGSNILNIMLVLGPTVAIGGPLEIDAAVLGFELPIMVAVAVACLPIFFIGNRVSRPEGALFLGYYVLYSVFIYLRATEHELQEPFTTALVWFVLPLTAITLAIFVARDIKLRRATKRHDVASDLVK
jgi:cation:H+ antiporter